MYRLATSVCWFMVIACLVIAGCERNEAYPTPAPTQTPFPQPSFDKANAPNTEIKAIDPNQAKHAGGNQPQVVARNEEAKATLYAIQQVEGEWEKFSLEVDGSTKAFPYWRSVTNPTYAPVLYFNDLNQDGVKELIIVLTKGYGTGVLDTEVHVFHKHKTIAGLYEEVLVDNPKAIALKNVKRKLTPQEITVTIEDKESLVHVEAFDQATMFNDIGFGSVTKFNVVDNQLVASVSCQISPAGFIGEILIAFEFKDGMYQSKQMELAPFGSEPTALKDAGQLLLEATSAGDRSKVQDVVNKLKPDELDRTLVTVMVRRHRYKYKPGDEVYLVRSLIRKGADPNAVDGEGQPVIFLARSADLLSEFVDDKRVELNAIVTPFGATLLLAAIGARNVDNVRYLLEKGVDPNKEGTSKIGETQIPIHMAIQYDAGEQIVKLLVSHPKIDLNKRNQENMNALEWAQHLKKSEFVKLIQDKL